MNTSTCPDVIAEVRGHVGCLTLNRPQAMNALSLDMVRALTTALLAWREDPQVQAVAFRGNSKSGSFGAFCAGGDIRFFHRAALAGDPTLDDFFTEEYTLNHLIHHYPKPTVAFMDGVCMGGGMGLGQGARWRVVTERSQLAMPETLIGLFPDVGGGHFLSRCPGHLGEYLALTGQSLLGAAACAAGWADVCVPSDALDSLWAGLTNPVWPGWDAWVSASHQVAVGANPAPTWDTEAVNRCFAGANLSAIVAELEALATPWAQTTLAQLRHRSPLMLHVTLEQIRRARHLTLAQDLRMERDLVRHCFQLRPGPSSETVEGIRALVVDKDKSPRWNPQHIAEVTPDMVASFFTSPWPPHAHPLRHLT